jgi:hypothetical protein
MFMFLLEGGQPFWLVAAQAIGARLRGLVFRRLGWERLCLPLRREEVESTDDQDHKGDKEQVTSFHAISPGST